MCVCVCVCVCACVLCVYILADTHGTDNGELFTWGRAGPYLGYKVEDGNKQLHPRRVTELEQHRVTQVACGCAHTLGECRGGS